MLHDARHVVVASGPSSRSGAAYWTLSYFTLEAASTSTGLPAWANRSLVDRVESFRPRPGHIREPRKLCDLRTYDLQADLGTTCALEIIDDHLIYVNSEVTEDPQDPDATNFYGGFRYDLRKPGRRPQYFQFFRRKQNAGPLHDLWTRLRLLKSESGGGEHLIAESRREWLQDSPAGRCPRSFYTLSFYPNAKTPWHEHFPPHEVLSSKSPPLARESTFSSSLASPKVTITQNGVATFVSEDSSLTNLPEDDPSEMLDVNLDMSSDGDLVNGETFVHGISFDYLASKRLASWKNVIHPRHCENAAEPPPFSFYQTLFSTYEPNTRTFLEIVDYNVKNQEMRLRLGHDGQKIQLWPDERLLSQQRELADLFLRPGDSPRLTAAADDRSINFGT